ncbi:uncharacterized protein LOC141527720 [Cotesia typhae]|uniref:uncharacterized protein LOC141527720 n=1 Tax=Cotesia typhae TaxID=2053667 RepID=UPI003D69EB9B
MEAVKVYDNNGSVKLTIKNRKISINTIKRYFPGASSLTYYENGEKFGVEVENEDLLLVKDVDEYEIYYANHLKENTQNNSKKCRIQEIMDVLENKSDENTKVEVEPKSQKPTKKIQRKMLYIAWKHKTSLNERFYKQMRDPVGGIKKIELDRNLDYSFDEIRQLSITAMRNTFNEHIFDSSAVVLATNDEETITKFTNVKGQPCDFWDFSSKLKLNNGLLRLCLLTIRS